MKKVIIQNSKRWDWKDQAVGEGDDAVDISSVIAKIERGYYQTEEVEIDLQVHNLRCYSFSCDTLFDFLTHVHLMQKSQLKYPVIINREGYIIDGRHRLCKAIMQGKKKLKGIMILDSSLI